MARARTTNRTALLPEKRPRQIELRGVRVHNLKNVDLDIPLGRLVVFSGVSGSGKSSLAFDTIFAEGQRRYIESFSVSARQYLERIERPNADRIAHVPPPIAIRSDVGRSTFSARVTVVSLSEIDDELRRLFSHLGRVVCSECGVEVRSHSVNDIVGAVADLPPGTRLQLCFSANEDESPTGPAAWLARGFTRAIVGDQTLSVDTLSSTVDRLRVWLVVDRLAAGASAGDRLAESAETAMREGDGRCVLLVQAETSLPSDYEMWPLHTIDGRSWRVVRFSRHWECGTCRREFLPPVPRLFEPDSGGGCQACRDRNPIDADVSCPVCRDTHVCAEALAVRIGGDNIADLLNLTVDRFRARLREITSGMTVAENTASRRILDDIDRRVQIVHEIGLGHLVLRRRANTLSAGETRRLLLAAAIGSRVTGTLCLVDEPSAGLHPKETPLVIHALRQLLEQRNSVIVVDHASEIIRSADHVIELGPGAGPLGGEIAFTGTPDELAKVEDSATGRVLRDQPNTDSGLRAPRSVSDWLTLNNVQHRNLLGMTVRVPLGVLCVVTGPGGAGKTSLVIETLVPALCSRLGQAFKSNGRGRCDAVTGGDALVEVAMVDQSPLTRSSRSNAATWIEVFDDIREVFALTAEAKQRGFGPQHFSFNAAQGGRCRACRGTGMLRHDMQFLPDITLPCPECSGTRYRREILDVKYRGRSIADVLAMSAAEAASFFRNHPRLQSRLQMLKQIGLDYLVLGQPTDTLSGGEAQRLKLASRLTASRGPTLIVCDEATVGLHPSDVSRLVGCFDELLAIGHSLVVIDHSPDLIRAADYLIELGPSSGENGGRIVFEGSPPGTTSAGGPLSATGNKTS